MYMLLLKMDYDFCVYSLPQEVSCCFEIYPELPIVMSLKRENA